MDPSAQITQAYQTYLGRTPSQDEINWHLNDVSNYGLTRALSIIQNSPEASTHSSAPAAAPAAASTGPDSSALTNFASTYAQGYQGLIDQQNAEQQGLFDQYTTAVNGQTKLPDLYTQLSGQLGLPDIGTQLQGYKDEVYRTQGLLDRLGDDVTSRTNGSLTTNAQRDAIISAETQPLETTLSRLGTGMQPLVDEETSAQNQLSTLLPLYEQQQEKDLSPLEMQINSLSDKFAREITGFTTEKQQDLTAILDEIQRGRQLSDRDWQAAQDLAASERDYQHNLSLAKVAASSSNYLSSTPTASTPSTATPISQLPSLSASMLPVQQANNSTSLIFPNIVSGSSLQGNNTILQGSSNGLQGSGVGLQG